jgi:hypothetical protein
MVKAGQAQPAAQGPLVSARKGPLSDRELVFAARTATRIRIR